MFKFKFCVTFCRKVFRSIARHQRTFGYNRIIELGELENHFVQVFDVRTQSFLKVTTQWMVEFLFFCGIIFSLNWSLLQQFLFELIKIKRVQIILLKELRIFKFRQSVSIVHLFCHNKIFIRRGKRLRNVGVQMVLLLLSLLILFNFAGEDKFFWVRYVGHCLIRLCDCS